MEETKDTSPSVLVFIVSASGDVEALKNGALDYLKKPRKNILPRAEQRVQPGSLPADVTLNQYYKIQQAIRFINDAYRTDIRLNAAAGEAGMSPSHFSRIFKKVMGLSYQAYLNERRIAEAKNLLRTGPKSVSEIAEFLGFSDATGFGRIFKKLTGQTPSAYRSSLPRERFLPRKA